MTEKNNMGIRGFDFVEFYVGSAKMVSYWFAKALGFTIKGYLGPETGHRDRTSYFLSSGDIKVLVTSSIRPESRKITSFLENHGDGVKKISFEVDDVDKAFNLAFNNGAVPIEKPKTTTDENGSVIEASIKIYDDTELVFINYDNYNGLLKPGYSEPIQDIQINNEDTKLLKIDHIVGNVRRNEMDSWAEYFNKTMDFETFIDFGPGDISTKYSSLLSKVVRTKDEVIKMPINEAYDGIKKSQIEEFIDEYKGTGIQHIAISTDDILASIKSLRDNGVEFLSVPDSYYNLLRERNLDINENIDDLERLGILCDYEGDGYLLQLFTKPIGDRPTFFFEIIQRVKNSKGFGQGNFQALFESIERDQEKRGNLV